MSRSMPDDTSTKATCGAHAGHPSLNAHETRPAGAALRLSQSSRRWLCDEAPSTVTALGKAWPCPRPPAAIARAKAHCCAPDAEGDGRGGIHAVRTMLTASGMRTAKPAPILEDDDGTDAASERCTASPPLSVPSALVTLSAFSSAVSSGCWPLQRTPCQALCQRHVAVRLPTALPISIGAAGFAGLSRPQSPAAAPLHCAALLQGRIGASVLGDVPRLRGGDVRGDQQDRKRREPHEHGGDEVPPRLFVDHERLCPVLQEPNARAYTRARKTTKAARPLENSAASEAGGKHV